MESIAARVLWLATRMIHEANSVRPSSDGLKVGGHQASSASTVSILTALYFHWLRPDDLVSVKPHAAPAYHAVQYLLGGLDRQYLTTLRSFGGLQAYPSRTKDPDRIDFSTGSVGLGAVAPLYAALADRYLRARTADAAQWPQRRFVAVVGDAELDEGVVWESAIEDALRGLGNVTIIVDLNRQSLDRVVPGIRVRQLEAMFGAAGWQVLEAKYGRKLQRQFDDPSGRVLRRRIDEMANEEYQSLLRAPAGELRARLIEGSIAGDRQVLSEIVGRIPDDALPDVLGDLGGHDIEELVRVLEAADHDLERPAIVFAYTIKGWRLPFAGDPMNHAAALTSEQIRSLAPTLGARFDDPWAAFDDDSPEGRVCRSRGEYLMVRSPRSRANPPPLPTGRSIDIRIARRMSTQQAFGDVLVALARDPEIGERIVTAAPDVAISTSLGGWVNRVGVYSARGVTVPDHAPSVLRWEPRATGRHVELGISEMNLFMWLSQFGLTAELFGERLIPIGTVYDPFICRGLDALIYALYARSRFILVGTPSGVTLAPEGGAHQSTITGSIGIELPGLNSYEPAFAQEVAWLMEAAIDGVTGTDEGHSTYLRLSTRLVDQQLADRASARLGHDEWRRQVIAGGYRLVDAHNVADLPASAPVVNIAAVGAVVSEALEAVDFLIHEEVAANLLVISSPDRLSAEMHDSRLVAARTGRVAPAMHLGELLPERIRHAPVVTVVDGASHTLSFIGSAFGVPVVPLGVDCFGQSGTIGDLYKQAGISTADIIDGALLAIELSELALSRTHAIS